MVILHRQFPAPTTEAYFSVALFSPVIGMLIGYVAGLWSADAFIAPLHSQKVRRASFRPTETLHRSRGSASALTPASRGWEQSHRDRSVGDDVAVRLDWRLLLSLRQGNAHAAVSASLGCLRSAPAAP